MAGHLAGEQRAGFLELRLDERMAGLPDQRSSAVALDVLGKETRALHVVDDLGAGIAAENVLREQHERSVGEDDFAVLRHHTEPVAVAVERESELGVAALQRLDEVDEVRRLRRVRMVVRETAVDLAVELGHLAAKTPVEARREHAGDTVAAVDRDAELPRELHVAGDSLDVGI